jgi:4-hydroxy-tetrahydrodipicolinate synthase
VPITLPLIERLLGAYPETVAGVKDSGGDWANTQAMITVFAGRGFDVFAGSEAFLLQNLRAGGVGCITATGNVNPGAIDHLYRAWRSADADRLQAELTATRAVLQQVAMIPALKATVAHFGGDPAWRAVRPPLVELTPAETRRVVDGLTARGFTMPGLRGPAS